MAAVTTERLMAIALELAGWDAIPADSAIYYPGTRISHVLIGIDAGTAELFMAEPGTDEPKLSCSVARSAGARSWERTPGTPCALAKSRL